MNTFLRFFTALMLIGMSTCGMQAQESYDYDKANKVQNWFADRCEDVILKFEGIRRDAAKHPQKYAIIQYPQAAPLGYALVDYWITIFD